MPGSAQQRRSGNTCIFCLLFDSLRDVGFLRLSTPTDAMISFKDTQLALIHIPLHLYSNFLQSILQLLLPNESRNGSLAFNPDPSPNGAVQPPPAWPYEHPFVNISVTPIECSVVCSRTLADSIFIPAINQLDASARNQVSVTSEDYLVMQVDGEGLDAGQRVLELTSPLALAGMYVFLFFFRFLFLLFFYFSLLRAVHV